MVKMWNKHFGVIFDFMPESHPTLPELVLNAKIICLKVPRFKIKTLSFQNVSNLGQNGQFQKYISPSLYLALM